RVPDYELPVVFAGLTRSPDGPVLGGSPIVNRSRRVIWAREDPPGRHVTEPDTKPGFVDRFARDEFLCLRLRQDDTLVQGDGVAWLERREQVSDRNIEERSDAHHLFDTEFAFSALRLGDGDAFPSDETETVHEVGELLLGDVLTVCRV